MNAKRGIIWLRRDLRLADNPALEWACREAGALIFVYVHAPDEDGSWRPGATSRWWLHHSLHSLSTDLRNRGQRLVLLRGDTLAALLGLAASTAADFVCWNRQYEPLIVERDRRIKAALREQGIEARSFNGALLFEPWEIATARDEPYRVFSPYWRSCRKRLDELPPVAAGPQRLPAPPRLPASIELDRLELLPRVTWDTGLRVAWQPGERGAARALQRFVEDWIGHYASGRNRPGEPATSRLSPHLHFGELSPRQVLAEVRSRDLRGGAASAAEGFIRELGWREFAHHLLYHFPHTTDAALDERFADYPWSEDAQGLEHWQRGTTGYPMVDAGMRELWRTGWMHNRVRMVVASFLTKNLRQHWLHGARWFWDTLVDADLANNTLGWQWTAGCGADAAPYFRVFNPVLQVERYDPQRVYLRQWLPELAALPDAWIHRPWEAPREVLARAGVRLGNTYPQPVVELRASRAAALAGYRQIRSGLS